VPAIGWLSFALSFSGTPSKARLALFFAKATSDGNDSEY
jgi:hypothetical protein